MDNLIFNEVTVVVCSFLSHEKLSKLISSVDNRFKILIIDNAREFNVKKYYNSFSNITYHIPVNDLGLSGSYNYALNNCSTKYIFITQPDVTLELDTISKLYNAMIKYKNSAILSSKVLNDNDQLDTEYRLIKFNKKNKIINIKNKFKKNFLYQEITGDICVDAVTCTTMFINCEFIKKIGGWDNNYFMYCEDIDLCLRTRISGYEIIKVFDSKVKHLGFSSHSEEYNEDLGWDMIYLPYSPVNFDKPIQLVIRYHRWAKILIIAFIIISLVLVIFLIAFCQLRKRNSASDSKINHGIALSNI
jgi:GT2 family glycosyltransferase